MRYLVWVFRLFLFALVLSFSVRNTELVLVRWLPGLQVYVPLVFALLVALLVGAALAWLSLLPSWLKAKRLVLIHQRQLEALQKYNGTADLVATQRLPDTGPKTPI